MATKRLKEPEYTGEEETAEIMADPIMLAALRRAMADKSPGIPAEEIAKVIHDRQALQKLIERYKQSPTTA